MIVVEANIRKKEVHDIDFINRLFNSFYVNQLQMIAFFALSGNVYRFCDTNNLLNANFNPLEDDRTPYLSTISRKTTDILYSQIWSNNNHTIQIDEYEEEDQNKLVALLNNTNFASFLYYFIKDIVDIGVAYAYIEELKEEPYIRYRIINPANILFFDDVYYYAWVSCHYTDKRVPMYTVLSKHEKAFSINDKRSKMQSIMQYDNIVAYNTNNDSFSLHGAGISVLGTTKSVEESEEGLYRHAEKLIDPPIVTNAQMIADDNIIDLSAGGVTKAEVRYDTNAGTPIRNSLDDYRSIIPELTQMIQFNTAEIEKAYMLDMLQSEDPSLRMGAYQMQRNILFNELLPKMIHKAIKIFTNKKVFSTDNKTPKIKFKSISSSPWETSLLNNFSQFMQTFANINQLAIGEGEQVDAYRTTKYVAEILNINKNILSTDDELTKYYAARTAQMQQQQQQQQPQIQQQQQ